MVDWDTLVLGPLQVVFGEPVTFTPAVGSPAAVTGVFDEAYREIDLAGGVAVTSEHPVLGIRLSAFPSTPKQGDHLTIRNAVYAVREVQLDGHGSAKLLLNLA